MIKVILFVVLFLLLAVAIGVIIWMGIVYAKSKSNTEYDEDLERLEKEYERKREYTYGEERRRLIEEYEAAVEAYKSTHTRPKARGKVGLLSSILVAIAALGLVITIPGSFHQVDTGTVAVVRNLGKIVGIRNPGTYFDFYMVNSYELYDTKVQQDKITTMAYSKDGQTMELEVFLQYQVQSENIMEIATQYGTLDALQARIETQTIEKTKAVMSSDIAMNIIQNRAHFSNEVSESVRAGISTDYYVNVKDVVLTNIDFSDEFERSVENKVIAEQDKQAAITKAEAELEVAKLEAQKKIEEARGNAEAQKIIAQAAAEAATYNIVELSKTIGYTVTETYKYSVDGVETEFAAKQAETETVIFLGTKYVIDTTSGPGVEKFKALVEDYLAYLQYLETWDGKLPDVIAGDNALSIIVPNS